VEIDYCPTCRGVWLDRGELDKLIERASREERYERHEDDDDRYPPQRGGSSPQPPSNYPKKKESFFSQLFDFD
jgi:Zn-finger nucleic acid-binding protein